MYAEVEVVVAGAVDEREIFTDETLIDQWLGQLEQESQGDGYRYEVYRIDHDHAQGVDCECVQFLTDHQPYRVFNADGNI